MLLLVVTWDIFMPFFVRLNLVRGDDYDNIVGKRQSIIDLHYLMLCISANNEYVYERWKTVVTQMIEKDPGCPKIFWLQVIHLICTNTI